MSLNKLIRGEDTITDPQQIANAFNLHFSTIGITLRNALPITNHLDFVSFLPPSNQQSIYLSPSTASEVVTIIKNLKNKKSNIHSPPVKLYKHNADLLAIPISLIFNHCLDSGIYPDLLKIACVTVLYKTGEKSNVNNYRPISCLPLLNKIFEKLVYARLYSFLPEVINSQFVSMASGEV